MHYSVCMPAVLRDKEIGEAMKAVKAAGYDHYEFWGWWNYDLDVYAKAQQETGLSLAAICTRFIPLTNPACRSDYLEGLRETIPVCRKLDCRTIISQVGNDIDGMTREAQHASIVEGLKACVPMLEEADMTLVIEPLNTRIDHVGYYLWSSREAYQIIDEVGSEHVKVLYDIYHQYVMNDVQVSDVVKNIDKIGHFHMAGYPGRHEPLVDSEIDYPAILSAIAGTGYTGSVGLEYFPVKDAVEGIKEFLVQAKGF